MTKEDFVKGYCERSRITEDEYNDEFVALPCNCDEEGCKGWATVPNNPILIEDHKESYMRMQGKY